MPDSFQFRIRKLFSTIHPLYVLFGLLSYGMGLGLAKYLGVSLVIISQVGGGLVIMLLMFVSILMNEYFRPATIEEITVGGLNEHEKFRSLVLNVTISLLAIALFFIYMLFKDGYLSYQAGFFFLIFLLLAVLNAIPPFRLSDRGLFELSLAIQVGSLAPSIGFLLQYNTFHRIIASFTFPLVFLGLACLLAGNFPTFAQDVKNERRSLLVVLSWQRAIPLHNVMLIVAYLLFLFSMFWGIPSKLVWPVFLTLPFAIFQASLLRNLGAGTKPNWQLLSIVSKSTLGLAIYLLTLTFWIR
jgi:1,4-dihydroxy-2-naphthoate octaprenyltransferase